MKNDEMLFDLVKEVREEQKEIREEIHQQSLAFAEHLATDAKMYQEITQINQTLAINTESLREHMKQTILVREQTEILKRMYELHSKRLDDLNRPLTVKELFAKISKVSAVIAAISGAIYGIARLLE